MQRTRALRMAFCLTFTLGLGLAQTSTAPHTKDGHPDLSGVWIPDGKFSGDFSKALLPGEKITMLPAAEKIFKETKRKDDPVNRCLPMGLPRLSTLPEKFVQTPAQLVILEEGDIHTFRLVYLGNRPHPAEPGPSWYGDSIGKWDGDTLVVDTIGFNDRTWLDAVGHPHTEKLHVTERYRRPDTATLVRTVTVEDPGAYAKPFKLEGTFKLAPATREIRENYCYKSPVDK
jgi:hypothetical protein